jgi:TRAP-type C4-dicarboxylate transport system permease small subunit
MKSLLPLLRAVSAVALFAMMVLTFADVMARKFLPNAIVGAVELTELLMMVMIFVALPLASAAGEHIAFDLFDRMLPPRLLRLQHRLAHGLTALVFGGAAWLVWQRAFRTAGAGDQTSALEIKLAPYHFMAAGLLALTVLVHLWLAWRAVPGLSHDGPDAAPDPRSEIRPAP